MKLIPREVNVIRGGEGTERRFTVGNVGRILNILREKMYSDPIRAIAREISCNARDAHREVGTPDLPIQIQLPNSLDPHLKIKDWGPGICPDRMYNIFIRYGNSTKSNDNVQLGCWGLGSKTPFAYSDQFSIITTTGGVKRTYIAFIDESDEGAMRLMSEEETDEPTGTEIIVPVKEKDWEAFAVAVISETKFWDIKPILKGRNPAPVYPTQELLLKGEGWKLFKKDNYCEDSFAIVDGIGYKIEPYKFDYEHRDLLNSGVYMYFGIGDVALAASREQLHYDDAGLTKNAILKRIESIRQSAKDHLKDKVIACASLTEASRCCCSLKTRLKSVLPDELNDITWNGRRCDTEYQTFDTVKFKVDSYILKRGYRGTRLKRRENVKEISLEEKNLVIFNDVTRKVPPRDRIMKILGETDSGDHPTVKCIYAITLRNSTSKVSHDLAVKLVEGDDLFNQIDVGYFSSTSGTERKPRSSTGTSVRSKGYVWDPDFTGTVRKCDYYWEPRNMDFEDGEGIYVVLADNKQYILPKDGGSSISTSIIRSLSAKLDCKIYGVRSKDVSKLGPEWKSLFDAVTEVINDEFEDENELVELANAVFEDQHTLRRKWGWLANAIKENNDLLEPGLLRNYYDQSIEIEKKVLEHKDVWNLSCVTHPQLHKTTTEDKKSSLKKMGTKVENRYPLIRNLSYYNVDGKAVIEYVNAIEFRKNNKESAAIQAA